MFRAVATDAAQRGRPDIRIRCQSDLPAVSLIVDDRCDPEVGATGRRQLDRVSAKSFHNARRSDIRGSRGAFPVPEPLLPRLL